MSEGAKPGIFISHTSADEELARGLGVLVDRAFAGGVTPWYSSDKGPHGGLSPGERWYERIEGKVCGSIQVLAVITRRSWERPWIYWEAGMGAIACKGKVCPVTFRVEIGEVGPPLSYYQAVDGLDEESLASGVTKIGPLVDLRPDGQIVKQCVREFVASAKPVADTIDDILGQLARMGHVEKGTRARLTLTGKAYEGALLGKNESIAELRRRVLSGQLPRGQVWDNLAATAELMGLSDDEELEAIPSAARAVLGGLSG